MTIKELEERTGMPRANIRYYEEEKLISPVRLPNGYRDYSEEDANTLEKIKLLRQLHLDIDTIRLIQQGKLPLEKALFNQMTRLEGDRNTINRALEVCRKLERSGVEYTALEPKVWLEEMKKPVLPPAAAPAKPVPPKEEPTEAELWTWRNPASDHPWMRYFARMVDLAIYGILFDLLGWLFIPAYAAATGDRSVFVRWLLSLLSLIFALAVEPFWLRYWGYTPGKWIFGLKLRDRNGEKLSLGEGYERSFRVFMEGYGWNVPIYNLVRLWKGRRCCVNGENCPWDAQERYLYGREERRLYGLRVAGVYLLSLLLTVFMVLELHLPRNREPEGLTVAQYSENYNHVLKANRLEDVYAFLEADGSVRKAEGTSGGVVINLSGLKSLPPEYTVEDGILKEVVLTTVKSSEGSYIYWNMDRELIYWLAFSGAADVNLFNYGRDRWLRTWEEETDTPWADHEFEYRGFKVVIDCEVSGYTGTYLIPVEGKEQSLKRTVTITWMGEDRS